MRTNIYLLIIAVTLAGSCVDDNQGPILFKRNPSCQISPTQSADMTVVTIRGVCTDHAKLWGGAATVDNKPVFYVNNTGKAPLNVFVSCPFEYTVKFKTPPQDVDWNYVLLLEADDIPGLKPCWKKLDSINLILP